MRILQPLLILLVLGVLAAAAILRFHHAAILTLVVVLFSFVPVILLFEKGKPKPSEIVPIAVISAIAVLGRVVMMPLPNIQPVSALVIVAGIFFGRQSGYLTGMFTAIVSNMMLGQGLWTPWQMFAWSTMGYVAGVLAEHGAFGTRSADVPPTKFQEFSVYLYGAIASGLYGILMDSWFIIGFLQDTSLSAVLAAYGAGVFMNINHVIATVVFLFFTYTPWRTKIRRIKMKYGL
jgi:energy-coupling factor transport system substrate-specific component